MLAKLKVLLRLADNTQDEILGAILDIASGDFLTLTHRTEIPSTAENVVLRMAMVRYNMLMSEGTTSQSIQGVSETFGGYDDNLLAAMRNFRKVIIP